MFDWNMRGGNALEGTELAEEVPQGVLEAESRLEEQIGSILESPPDPLHTSITPSRPVSTYQVSYTTFQLVT